MTASWERCIRLNEPLKTKPFVVAVALAVLGLLLGFYRELSGLGYVTGLNDGYSWGLFKNWNVTALTAFGSGGYAVAVLTWIYNERKFHPIMRTAVLTSLLGYGSGMLALGFDVGRPWNFVWLAYPKTWNHYSVLWEVAVCMTSYFLLALDVENMPPFLEKMYRSGSGEQKMRAVKIFRFLQNIFPFLIALAFVLPSMHQASLGELMYLAGPRVHPLWQSPMLPLLYLMMAYILGFACVLLVLALSAYVWELGWDREILGRLALWMAGTALVWAAFRFGDLAYRGVLGDAVKFDRFSIFFLAEEALVIVPALLLLSKARRESPGSLFRLTFLISIGGLLYRFTPTSLAFSPLGDYRYFPSVFEILMSVGFTALAVALFLYAVKTFAILPATKGKIAAEEAMRPFDTL
ncbi:MAG TPA: Ni/Fe-hydrogenase cytochrome b subunit [Candidatus Eisenbacteria bacterium]|nr:Ni/Fe-hydrogenase cytochrome b subunit [Candidatus Eisenbacteria bacterium]